MTATADNIVTPAFVINSSSSERTTLIAGTRRPTQILLAHTPRMECMTGEMNLFFSQNCLILGYLYLNESIMPIKCLLTVSDIFK